MHRTNIILVITVISLISLSGCAERWWTHYGIPSSRQLMTQEAVPGLTAALSDSNPAVRHDALRYLNRIGLQANSATSEVQKLINNEENPQRKIYAIRTLYSISQNNDDTLNFLYEISNKETDENTQQVCKDIISLIKGNSGSIVISIDGTEQNEFINISFRTDYKYFNGFRRIDMVRNSGILPFKVEITNNTSTTILVNPDTFELLNQNQVPTKKPYQFSIVDEQQVSIAKTFIFGFPGASQARAAVANVKIENYFKEHVFKPSSLTPGEQISGYVYFEVPNTTKNISGWEFKLTVDENNNSHQESYKF